MELNDWISWLEDELFEMASDMRTLETKMAGIRGRINDLEGSVFRFIENREDENAAKETNNG